MRIKCLIGSVATAISIKLQELVNKVNIYVFQVDLVRRDRIKFKLMQLGKPLLETMKVKSEHAIHQFHRQHR